MVSIQQPSGAVAPKYFALRSRGALAVSILMHAVLILILARTEQHDEEPRSQPRARIVWLGEIRADAGPAPPSALPPERARPQRTEQTRPRAAESRPESVQAHPHPRKTHSHAVKTRSSLPTPASPARAAPKVDLEALRHRVVEQLVAQQARLGGLTTRSPEGIAKNSAQEDPNPWHAVWTAAVEGRVGGGCDGCGEPTVLHAGQQRTRIGRAAAGLCRAFLGGGDFFGLFSLCGSYDSGPDLDSPIRPDYLKKRPLCGQITPQQSAAELAAGADFIPSVKCRLVDDTERQAGLKRADGDGSP